jgi:predicted HAD superfamily phosphohydrolase
MSAGGPASAAGGAAGAGRAPRRIYVTDCEGPLTRNDNAQEIAERFLPDGAELFARLSKYDDFLADVVRKPGYNAGDTLRLLPPFLKAFAVSDEGVEAFSAEGVRMVPGAIEALTEIAALLPTFIISTSYTPYLKALCELFGFPLSNVRCTELSLDAWLMPEDEKAWLRDEAAHVMQRSLIEIPEGATSADDLSPADAVTVARLDDLFWAQMDGRVSGELVAGVRPVGGGRKLAALEEIVAAEGVEGAGVMYVGDSITDAPTLAAVKAWGGVSLSFNGNGYALEAAEFAAASSDAGVAAELAKAFAAGGRDGVEAAVRAWPKPKRGELATGRARARVGLVAEEPDALAEASAAARRGVRGERIARLG